MFVAPSFSWANSLISADVLFTARERFQAFSFNFLYKLQQKIKLRTENIFLREE